MPLSAFQLSSIASAVTTYILNRHYGGSWWWAIPIFITYLIGYNGYRMLIYERFLNPISRLPGPKVLYSQLYLVNTLGTLALGRIPLYSER